MQGRREKGDTMNTDVTEMSRNRIAWIDFVKFSGILFVLMNHAELKIPLISRFGGLFYVPVFFVLAGLTYQHREESLILFIKRKAKRLLLPYFGYNIFLYLFFLLKDYIIPGKFTLQALMPLVGILYSRNSLYRMDTDKNIYFLTVLNSPTWFLTALFLGIVLFEISIRLVRYNWRRLCLINILFTAVGIIIYYLSPVLLPWSMESILIFEVMIASGFALQKKAECIKKKQDIIATVILFTVIYLLAIFNGTMNVSVGAFGKLVFVGILLSVASSLWIIWICYGLRNHIPMGAALIGEHSMIIMCLHMFVFMFIKTGFNIIHPGLLEGDTVAAVLAKSMMVALTMAILTIGEISWNLLRRRRRD